MPRFGFGFNAGGNIPQVVIFSPGGQDPMPPSGFSFVTTNSNSDQVVSGQNRVIARNV